MKTTSITLLAIGLTTSQFQAHATVKNSDGNVGVDPIFNSDEASILITGEAAHQLYLHLQIDGGQFEVKQGKNILCRKAINYSGGDESFQCKMAVSPDGTLNPFN